MKKNPTYTYQSDGTLLDKKTGQVIGRWYTSKKTGHIVAQVDRNQDGVDDTSGRAVPTGPVPNPSTRYGNNGTDEGAGVEYPIYSGPPAPGMPDTQRSFSSGKEKVGTTQLLPNIGQQNVPGAPQITTPQLSRTTVGKKGLTPGEILNFLSEHENQLRGAGDQQRQQGLNQLYQALQSSLANVGVGGSKGVGELNNAINATRNLYGQGVNSTNSILGGMAGQIGQNFNQSLGAGMGMLSNAYGGARGDLQTGMSAGAQALKAGQQGVQNLYQQAQGAQGLGMYDRALGSINGAAGQARGDINGAYGRAVGSINSAAGTARNDINSAYGQGQNYLTGSYGQQRGDINSGYGQAQGVLSSAYNAGKGAINSGYGQAQNYLNSSYGTSRNDINSGYGQAQAGLDKGFNFGKQSLGGYDQALNTLATSRDKALGGLSYMDQGIAAQRRLYQQQMDMTKGFGDQERLRAQDLANKSYAASSQNLASRGFANSTAQATSRGVTDRNLNDANLGIGESVNRTRVGISQNQQGNEGAYGYNRANATSGIWQNYGNEASGVNQNKAQAGSALGQWYGSNASQLGQNKAGALTQNNQWYGSNSAQNQQGQANALAGMGQWYGSNSSQAYQNQAGALQNAGQWYGSNSSQLQQNRGNANAGIAQWQGQNASGLQAQQGQLNSGIAQWQGNNAANIQQGRGNAYLDLNRGMQGATQNFAGSLANLYGQGYGQMANLGAQYGNTASGQYLGQNADYRSLLNNMGQYQTGTLNGLNQAQAGREWQYGGAAAQNQQQMFGNLSNLYSQYGQNVANYLQPNYQDPTFGTAGNFGAAKLGGGAQLKALLGSLLGSAAGGLGSGIGGLLSGGLTGGLGSLFGSLFGGGGGGGVGGTPGLNDAYYNYAKNYGG